jgi:hypothetical protein
MTQVRIEPPQPVELVSVEVVEELVARTRNELATLERQVDEANAAADATEARASAEGADERSTNWTMVQLQRFLNGLRDELDLELRAIAEVADHRAKIRVEEAHAQAESLRRFDAEPKSDPIAPAVPEISEPTWAPLSLTSDPPPTPSIRIDPVPNPEPVVAPEPMGAPTPIVAAPIALRDRFDVQPLVVPDAPQGAPEAAPEAWAAPAAPAVDYGGIADPMSSGEEAAVAGSEFWANQPEPKRKKRLGRIPIAAVLQVLAVLVILAVILLRLG